MSADDFLNQRDQALDLLKWKSRCSNLTFDQVAEMDMYDFNQIQVKLSALMENR